MGPCFKDRGCIKNQLMRNFLRSPIVILMNSHHFFISTVIFLMDYVIFFSDGSSALFSLSLKENSFVAKDRVWPAGGTPESAVLRFGSRGDWLETMC